MAKEYRILYVAFHYPPILGSSGVHRTLAFTRYLVERNWNVDVLTSSLQAYDRWEESQLSFIPDKVNVIRAFGRNTAKHLSIKGKYLGLMALPDNWQSWIFSGVVSGLISILRRKPDVIVSTYPIASAHVIAYVLHKLSGIPWVADLRDPMAQEGYPANPRKKRIFQWLEGKMVKHCRHIVLTSSGAKALYVERFPQVTEEKWQIIPNGYDVAMFASLQTSSNHQQSEKIVLLHSGVVYPSERDPKPLFQAIAALKKSGRLSATNFELRLRATGHDEIYQPQLAKMNIADIVKLAAPVPFHEALKEMTMVDGLLLMQAANCDYQIPAKAYEYIRVGKPIFALTTEQGDTGQLMAQQSNSVIAPLDDALAIEQQLMRYLTQVQNGELAPLPEEQILRYSRQHHASSFEACLQRSIKHSI
ncbi:hypothetical protein DXX93_00670 [Thalassotalea euphylliae]|uniref:Glycosyltransferase subfamily 4-like N-terminal domain-containing protein n=1 Tax=Thalassotalea euphylliae TaxID=1655234 RepID=A0A3E0TKZ0_9GAMM|nr:glycosyltransferase [Thalassotalea euphylliae]REL25214.1 hypothetical protein DXX93_00670 [Thalassotalea euphylliae]